MRAKSGSGKSDVHRGEAGLEGAFVGAEVFLWESCVGSALEIVKLRTFRSEVSSALFHHLGVASLDDNRELVKHAALELGSTTIFDVVVRDSESLLAQGYLFINLNILYCSYVLFNSIIYVIFNYMIIYLYTHICIYFICYLISYFYKIYNKVI